MIWEEEPRPVPFKGLLPWVPLIEVPMGVSCIYLRVQPFADGGVVESIDSFGKTYRAVGWATHRIARRFGLVSSEGIQDAMSGIGEDPWGCSDSVLLKAALLGLYRDLGRILHPDTPPESLDPWGTEEMKHMQIERFARLIEEVS